MLNKLSRVWAILLARPACGSGPNASGESKDISVITQQCVKQEVQDEGSQLDYPSMEKTILQTSPSQSTELKQKPSCVCHGSHHHGSRHSVGRLSREGEANRTVSRASSRKPAAPPPQDGCCVSLLLACLSCEVASLGAGLLHLCSSCLAWLCCCCGDCTCGGEGGGGGEGCCEGLQGNGAEDLHCPLHCFDNCQGVLLEPCCEPVQCLDLCMECLKICHYG
ncbi:myoD family inhibitor domain-containing protein-like [Engraulis encrasicolus]|uniref:myoD family inhibitor domain-containing protein-like n=1 Tax=Engraulis encrasicolus TaxID=184585 RepID=UPI002FD6074B